MNENIGHTPQHYRPLNLPNDLTGLAAASPPVEGPLTFGRAPYGPLVETCAEYGIRRSRAHEYAQSGLIDTFTMGRKRYVYRASLDTLPERIAAAAGDVS